MSDHDHKRQTSTSVTTTTATQAEAAPSGQGMELLTPQEERVLRMLHGLSEEGAHELKFALGADDELRARLARLEHYLIKLFRAEVLDTPLMEEIRALKGSLTT